MHLLTEEMDMRAAAHEHKTDDLMLTEQVNMNSLSSRAHSFERITGN